MVPERSAITSSNASGPLLPFIKDAFAAVQPHQTSPSSTAQHFRTVEVGSTDQAADRTFVALLILFAKKVLDALGAKRIEALH